MKMFIASAMLLACISSLYATPLDDYVNTPDPHYQYTLLQTYQLIGAKVYVFNMTSQKWLDETIVKNPIWWHYVSISIPDKITRPDKAFMLINGGGNYAGVPKPDSMDVTGPGLFSETTGAVGVLLSQIPNQPTTFLADPTQRARSEDAIIAWTWKTFLENPNTSLPILLRLPMTKAAVRAMDTAIEFVQKIAGVTIKQFMVAGASKRGWTTWTTAAVDKRVFAAIPIVMDLLNLNQNMHSHFRSLGGWTFAFESYYELNVTKYVDTWQMFAMQQIVDPAFYFDRYKDVKFMVVSTSGDEFFLGDDTYYFWEDFVAATNGSCLLRRLPNAEHSLAGHTLSLFFSFRSFFMTLYENKPVPIVRWFRPNNSTHGIIEASVDIQNGLKPFNVEIYFARTLDSIRRDFRLFVKNPNDPSKPKPHPVIWQTTKTGLSQNETSTKINYKATMLRPITGWTGFFIQFSFASIDNTVIQVTTETNIVPETYPFEDCTLDSCIGTLV